jgi:hypothetical protein
MARSSFSASARAFKCGIAASPVFHDLLDPAPTRQAEPALKPDGFDPSSREEQHFAPRLRVSTVHGVTPDDLVAIMTALEESGGTREIGDLAWAIPHCPRPISAILALVDAGLLAIDLEGAFDASTRVTRIA